MNNFKRLIAAAVILPGLIAYIYFLPPPYFLALLVGISVLAMREFCIMYKVPLKLYLPGILVGGILFYMSCVQPAYFLDGIFIGIFLLLLIRLLTTRTPSGIMSEIGPLGVGFLYIAGFLSFQWFLRDDVLGARHIFFLYGSVWIADCAAYYIGTFLGKNKLYPAISPNKTVEGAFGSMLGGTVGAV
ncbi:MAG: phosphatidate cytidylyltransferase, partial [Nitrospirae bacterium]|nr:phosphatidate cytidylyltransferase [Nitrospirota bacterium]